MTTEQQMQSAVHSRDATYDGRFVYAVITTGVYCRPSCAARTPRVENLRYFPTAAEAAAAGFRPCKRCCPDEILRDFERVIEAARYIEANSDEPLTLARLAKRAGLSPARFQRAFKAAFGVSPKDYRDNARVRELKASLRSGSAVSAAIYDAGVGSTPAASVAGDVAALVG